MRGECMNENINDLVFCSRNGDNKATAKIFELYRSAIYSKTLSYKITGADINDVLQEGMIGLFRAIQVFNPDLGVSFTTFAFICIKNQILTAVKSANRHKHRPLGNYISIGDNENENPTKADVASFVSNEQASNPELIIIRSEENALRKGIIDSALSSFEKKVFDYYLDGLSYNEISEVVSKPIKSIDNAIQRIRKKLATIDLM